MALKVFGRGADVDDDAPSLLPDGSMPELLESGSVPDPPPADPPTAPRTPPTERPLFVFSAVLTILSVLSLTFGLTLSVIGTVRHARDQQTAFDDLRATLANATTPVTQTDETGNLLPLGTALAVIDIPQISLREVIFEGTNSAVLRSGPGHRRDTPMPGQAGTSVLMGRQAGYGGPFRAIGELVPGNTFNVTTGQGKQVFRVVAVRRAGDLQPQPVAVGKGRITLITAAGIPWVPAGLLRVDADLVSPTQPSGPRVLDLRSLPQPERPMQGDQSAWIFVLLLSQLLFGAAIAVTWARYRWGVWQAWLSGGPVLLAVGVALTDQAAKLLPNLM